MKSNRSTRKTKNKVKCMNVKIFDMFFLTLNVFVNLPKNSVILIFFVFRIEFWTEVKGTTLIETFS